MKVNLKNVNTSTAGIQAWSDMAESAEGGQLIGSEVLGSQRGSSWAGHVAAKGRGGRPAQHQDPGPGRHCCRGQHAHHPCHLPALAAHSASLRWDAPGNSVCEKRAGVGDREAGPVCELRPGAGGVGAPRPMGAPATPYPCQRREAGSIPVLLWALTGQGGRQR